jgi:hypothetical protein
MNRPFSGTILSLVGQADVPVAARLLPHYFHVKGHFPRSSHSCWEDQADSTVGCHRAMISLNVSGGLASCVVLPKNDINLSQQTLLRSSTQESSCLKCESAGANVYLPLLFRVLRR